MELDHCSTCVWCTIKIRCPSTQQVCKSVPFLILIINMVTKLMSCRWPLQDLRKCFVIGIPLPHSVSIVKHTSPNLIKNKTHEWTLQKKGYNRLQSRTIGLDWISLVLDQPNTLYRPAVWPGLRDSASRAWVVASIKICLISVIARWTCKRTWRQKWTNKHTWKITLSVSCARQR